jgi:glycyl-tRNA synthetase
VDMDKLVALCRRKGFIFQSSEIYGGINGFWDYGPLGVELKKNIKDAWWNDMVRNPPPGPDGEEIQMVGVDCAIIMNPEVWVASGHVGGFQDPMVACKTEGCKKLFRADKVWLVTVWPRGAVTNPEDVEAKTADPVVAAKSRSTTVAFQSDGGAASAAGLAQRAIREFGQKNNEGALKKFVEHGFERSLQAGGVYFRGRKEGTHARAEYDIPEGDEYDFECIIEPLVGARYAGALRPCPVCQSANSLTEPRAFNLMFESHAGAIQSEENKVYLRPETAQGIFVNFKNVLDSTHLKLPFGIAQVGKAFRNEINPRNYIFRSREFEQMEIEFFCHPSESERWYRYWRDLRIAWYSKLGIQSEKLRPREQTPEERAHYSVGTTDIEYLFPFADEPQELEGVAHRADYDLKQHTEHSGKDLSYFDEEGWAKLDKSAFAGDKKREQAEKAKFRFLPHVIEPSAGADRFALAVLCEAFTEDMVPDEKGEPKPRTVMKFHPRLAPVKAAILPLVNKEGMPEKAHVLYKELKAEFNVTYDDGGAVGRRYRRQDEAGTPWCITIDGQTLQDETVTIRDRDTTKQWRLAMAAVADELRKLLRP